MSRSTFTRYQCEWCGADVELTHPSPSASLVLPERPQEWVLAQFEDEPWDLCPYCAQALRELAASRRPVGASLGGEYPPA